jgi:hypothetical protein
VCVVVVAVAVVVVVVVALFFPFFSLEFGLLRRPFCLWVLVSFRRLVCFVHLIAIVSRGYYPEGGGEVVLKIKVRMHYYQFAWMIGLSLSLYLLVALRATACDHYAGAWRAEVYSWSSLWDRYREKNTKGCTLSRQKRTQV